MTLYWILICSGLTYNLSQKSVDHCPGPAAQKESISYMLNQSTYNNDDCFVVSAWWN